MKEPADYHLIRTEKQAVATNIMEMNNKRFVYRDVLVEPNFYIMKNLNVVIDPNSGFCFGVVFAVEMAEQILEERGYLYCLGDIVHNEKEVLRLQAKGLLTIDYPAFEVLTDETVLIRAHGEPPSTYARAALNRITLIDASCPVVLKLQNRIKKAFDQGNSVFILGKQGHAEVTGLMGQTNNQATLFDHFQELEGQSIPKQVTLYSQTTKSISDLYKAKEAFERSGVSVELHNTVCRQVSSRKQELKKFAQDSDIILFVSGSKSSNGKLLFESCKAVNPSTYFVSDPADICPDWFRDGEQVGICGATSTPMWLMKEVRQYVLEFLTAA